MDEKTYPNPRPPRQGDWNTSDAGRARPGFPRSLSRIPQRAAPRRPAAAEIQRADHDRDQRRDHPSLWAGRQAPHADALKAGATREEILETIQLTTVMGIHSCNLAVPILMEEVAKLDE